jgi:hypothetical protein
MNCFINKQQLSVICTYYDHRIFVMLLLILGFGLNMIYVRLLYVEMK